MTHADAIEQRDGIKYVTIAKSILAQNDQVAAMNRRQFDAAGILSVNVMAAPGAGKTSLIVKTIQALQGRLCVGVIEGDVAGGIDTARVLAAGAHDAVQINTGGTCHLEAGMIQRALMGLALAQLDLVFIENVGNLVCPTHWALGEQVRLCLCSAPEGHDKPIKYPAIFATSDVIVLNKVDLSAFVDFDRDFFCESVRALNATAPIFEVSCRSGAGVVAWVDWLLQQRPVPSVSAGS